MPKPPDTSITPPIMYPHWDQRERVRALRLLLALQFAGGGAGTGAMQGQERCRDTISKNFHGHVSRHATRLDDVDGDIASTQIAGYSFRIANEGGLSASVVSSSRKKKMTT
jgi:hypothetical protein